MRPVSKGYFSKLRNQLNKWNLVLSLLSFSQVKNRSSLIASIIKLMVYVTPAKILSLAPKPLLPLLSNTSLFLGMNSKCRYLANKIKVGSRSYGYAYSMILDSLHLENQTSSIKKILYSSFSCKEETAFSVDSALSWSFWNLDHKQFGEMLERLRSFSNSNEEVPYTSHRYLPDHSRNLGHLGCLYMYILYYGRHLKDLQRQIYLPCDKISNRVYFDLVRRNSPLTIECVDRKTIPPKTLRNFKSFDTLLYSFQSNGELRIESDASAAVQQSFPEWNLAAQYPLKLSDDQQSQGEELFRKITDGRWFVVLHIREEREDGNQARNARILDYSLMCQEITSQGGVVVRMGNTSFPKLPEDFPAFDYAHSTLRSEFADCWLWANMRYWVGNVNGAMLAALTFGKRRLITNQWYWNLLGGPTDLVVPKLLSKDGRILSPSATFLSGFSRMMNVSLLEKRGYKIVPNSPEVIRDSYLDLLSTYDDNLPLSPFEKEFTVGLPLQESRIPHMRLSKSFIYNLDAN